MNKMLSNKKKFFLNYLFLSSISLLIFAWFWDPVAAKLFYCSDSFPILNFIPPFVHGRTGSGFYKSTSYGDYYIASPTITYLVWLGFVLAALTVPALILYVVTKFQQKNSGGN